MRIKETTMITTKNRILVLLAVFAFGMPLAAQAETDAKPDVWLPSLVVDSPQEGFELAIKLARK